MSLFTKIPGGRDVSWISRSKWFGVKGFKSLGSPETVVRGLPLIILSASHNRV